MKLQKLKRDWEDIGKHDALWGILAWQGRRFGRWHLEEFFQTGVEEIKSIVGRVKELGFDLNRDSALDFGCGAGRLTQAMANYFLHCYGVDISSEMVRLANQYNRFGEKCQYMVNSSDDLRIFPDDYFDFIYSVVTLQHMKNTYAKHYIAEFIRTIKPKGIIVFQHISYLPLIYRLQPKSRLYHLMRSLGFPERFLFYTLRLFPSRMNFIKETELVDFMKNAGGQVLNTDRFGGSGITSCTYFATK